MILKNALQVLDANKQNAQAVKTATTGSQVATLKNATKAVTKQATVISKGKHYSQMIVSH